MQLAIAIIAVPLLAAEISAGTWHGLQFGASEATVTEVLKKSGAALQENGEGALDVTPDYSVNLPGVKVTFLFKPHLLFDRSRGLNEITLAMDVQKMISDDPTLRPSILAGLAANSIFEQLVAKYGRSVIERGNCEGLDAADFVKNSLLSCNAAWRADGQFVSLYWFYNNQQSELTFMVEYRPTTGDL